MSTATAVAGANLRAAPTFKEEVAAIWAKVRATVELIWNIVEPYLERLMPTLVTRTGSRIAVVAFIGAIGPLIPQLRLEEHVELITSLVWLLSLLITAWMAIVGRMNARGPVMPLLKPGKMQRGTVADLLENEPVPIVAAVEPATPAIAPSIEAPTTPAKPRRPAKKKPRAPARKRPAAKGARKAKKPARRPAPKKAAKRAAKRPQKSAGGRR